MAEFTAAPARNLVKIPGGIPFEVAAAAPACFTTARRMLITAGRLRAGQDLLVVGASDGLGPAALVIGTFAEARVLALVAGADKSKPGRLVICGASGGERPTSTSGRSTSATGAS